VKCIDCDSLEFFANELFSNSPAQIAVEICDKRAGAGLCDDDAFLLEPAIGLGYRVGIDGKLDG